ncbi:hypothetical protein CGRA01v4_14138 [Colletotrichum graminicola]|nr:hypothetical protein CGRA01v4_14138 [Colletotrichum graminicola]
MMINMLVAFLVLLALPASLASPTKSAADTNCSQVSGNKTISAYQLYPANGDYDTKRCVAYLSVLYNSTVAVWDPSINSIVETITLQGLSFNPLLHASGVRRDPLDRLSIIINAGDAFITNGQNIEGDNFLVKYDLNTRQELWRSNLTAIIGGLYGGYQDTQTATDGTTFVLGTYPSSIIRVSADGKDAAPWYLRTPANHTVRGIGGLAVSPDGQSLLTTDSEDGQLYRFNMSAAKGTPVRIPLSGADLIGKTLMGVSIPRRYGGNVLLATDEATGTVVLRSRDGTWNEAEVLGTVPGLQAEGGFSTATVPIGDSVYAVSDYFVDAKVAGSLGGNRTEFLLVDITPNIDALLA